MNQAKDVLDERSESAPLGFAVRVVARSKTAANGPARSVLRAFSIASWTAAVVIMGCGLILVRENTVAKPVAEIIAAAQFLAENISP